MRRRRRRRRRKRSRWWRRIDVFANVRHVAATP